jgi:hypothetical protein
MATVKKSMKSGGELGMKSVKSGYDKNPGVTRADIIVAAKKEAKSGAKMPKAKSGAALKKQAAIAISMKEDGKVPKKKMQYGGKAASMAPKAKNGKSVKAMSGMHMMPDGSMMKNSMMKMGGKMKSGGKMKTCKYGC